MVFRFDKKGSWYDGQYILLTIGQLVRNSRKTLLCLLLCTLFTEPTRWCCCSTYHRSCLFLKNKKHCLFLILSFEWWAEFTNRNISTSVLLLLLLKWTVTDTTKNFKEIIIAHERWKSVKQLYFHFFFFFYWSSFYACQINVDMYM